MLEDHSASSKLKKRSVAMKRSVSPFPLLHPLRLFPIKYDPRFNTQTSTQSICAEILSDILNKMPLSIISLSSIRSIFDLTVSLLNHQSPLRVPFFLSHTHTHTFPSN
eukprot:GILJ01031365.1.p1 GENE.GILJ01031365.1~~GILJ01031365.1.p1  ORF type:complete len:108 (-),score=4.23 GILJ01031365.1:135-458(-)